MRKWGKVHFKGLLSVFPITSLKYMAFLALSLIPFTNNILCSPQIIVWTWQKPSHYSSSNSSYKHGILNWKLLPDFVSNCSISTNHSQGWHQYLRVFTVVFYNACKHDLSFTVAMSDLPYLESSIFPRLWPCFHSNMGTPCKKWGFKGNFEIAFAPCDVSEVEATIAV